jgi:hypothetical protein
MADLLDIAPSTAVDAVTVAGEPEPIDVRRLNVDDIAALVRRFPSLVVVLDGGGAAALPGQAIAAVIAAGCGYPGNAKAEAKAGSYLVEDQFKLLNAILRLTFPNGISPVMQEVEVLGRLLGGAPEAPKAMKMRLKQSPSPSPASSDGAFHQTTL